MVRILPLRLPLPLWIAQKCTPQLCMTAGVKNTQHLRDMCVHTFSPFLAVENIPIWDMNAPVSLMRHAHTLKYVQIRYLST